MSIYFYYTTLQDFYFSMNPIWYYFISFLDLMTRILFYDTVISFLVCWIYNYIPFYYCIIFLLLSLFVFSYYYQNCVYCTSLKKKKTLGLGWSSFVYIYLFFTDLSPLSLLLPAWSDLYLVLFLTSLVAGLPHYFFGLFTF